MNIDSLIDRIADRVAERVADIIIGRTYSPNEYAHVGIQGIQEIFHCSRSKAQEMKNSGILDNAIVKNGRKFVIDKQKALECVAKGV